MPESPSSFARRLKIGEIPRKLRKIQKTDNFLSPDLRFCVRNETVARRVSHQNHEYAGKPFNFERKVLKNREMPGKRLFGQNVA